MNKIQKALDDWKNGKSLHEVATGNDVSRETAYAIVCGEADGNAIEKRLPNIRSGMRAAEIRKVMAGE